MRLLRIQCFLMVAQYAVAVSLSDLVNQPLERLLAYYKQDVDLRHKNWLFNPRVAKNVILFLVEGLDAHTMSVARQAMEVQSTAVNNYMTSLDFFISGHLKPASRDFIVADPSAAVSAIFNGLPEYNGQMGWVEQGEASCLQFDKSKKLLKNLFKVMSDAGKHTALFTTSRLTSPGVAGTYASSPDSQIESDIHLTESGCNDGRFKDIAVQLVKDYKNLNILIGRGRQYFMKYGTHDMTTSNSAYPWRNDIDLKTYWAMEKVLRKKTHKDATGTRAVKDALSADDDMQYFLGFLDEEAHVATTDDLQEITSLLVHTLNRMSNDKGYFLTIHDSQLARDHENNGDNLGSDLNKILKAINYLDRTLTRADDTLIVLASVQGSTLTLGSGRPHDESILGPSFTETCDLDISKIDYACGSRTRDNSTAGTCQDTSGGPDLPVYVRGPGSQAFTGINDFGYLYHALLYATCLSPDANRIWEHCQMASTSAPLTTQPPLPGITTTTNPNIPLNTTYRPSTQRPPIWPWLPQPYPHLSENPYGSLGFPYYDNGVHNLNPYTGLHAANSNPNANTNLNPNLNTNENPNPTQRPNGNPPNQNQNANTAQNINDAQAQNPFSWASLFPFLF